MTQSAEQVLNEIRTTLGEKEIWIKFFTFFMDSIQPAEFAIEDNGLGQRENAISAPSQYAFRALFENNKNIATALETPFSHNPREFAYADICIFPWIFDSNNGNNHWKITNNRKYHTRIEIKWRFIRTINCNKINDIVNESLNTKPAYTLIYLFHEEDNLNLNPIPDLGGNRKIIYCDSKKRIPEAGYRNPYMSLIVVQFDWND